MESKQAKKKRLNIPKKTIEKGNPKFMNNYIVILSKGDGIEMAIEKGSRDAMCHYASMLSQGDGVSVNKKEYFKYYKMAVDKGNLLAIVQLCQMTNKRRQS